MIKRFLFFIILLYLGFDCLAQSRQDSISGFSAVSGKYRVLAVHDYSFKELVNQGIMTADRQLDILNIPVREARIPIRWHIKSHNFRLGRRKRKKAIFRAVSFAYPSVSPQGDSVMLSGLVTFPVLDGNKLQSMLIYHRLVAPSNSIAPSNGIPLEAIISGDNTVCVFPDYYGCGTTEGKPLPFVALNYHARCATECALYALDVIRDFGIATDSSFYTWITGYSQGGGYALATHKYIEQSLPDSLARRINLKWSLCAGGIFNPGMLYENAILTNELGTTPTAFLQSLRGLFYTHHDVLDTLTIAHFLSDSALAFGLDSILNTHDDGMWDLAERLGSRGENHDPAYYYNPAARDTSSALYKQLMNAFALDKCDSGWHPVAPVVLWHSENDKLIPFHLAQKTFYNLSDSDSNCFLNTPKMNRNHLFSAFLYFSTILKKNETTLYKRNVLRRD